MIMSFFQIKHLVMVVAPLLTLSVDVSAQPVWDNHFIESVPNLAQPNLGDTQKLIEQSKKGDYLFSGTDYKPPDNLPFGFRIHDLAKEVEDRQAIFGFIINAGITAAVLWPGKFEQGDFLSSRNLKELYPPGDPRRYQLEDAVNFLYSIEGDILGLNVDTIDYLAGLLAIGTYAKRGNYLPYGGLNSIDKGDDPRGAIYSKMGWEYKNSGQYIKDYFHTKKKQYGFSTLMEELQYEGRIPAWQEAIRRLRLRSDTNSHEAAASLSLQWKAIERAQKNGENYSQALKTLQAQDQARIQMETHRTELDDKWRNFQEQFESAKRKELARLEELKRQQEEAEKKKIAELKKKAEEEAKLAQEEARRDAEKKKELDDAEKFRLSEYQRQQDQYSENNDKSKGGYRGSSGSGGGGGIPSTQGDLSPRMP